MRSKINLIIDAIMLIVLMVIAGMGFLMKYVLIPGYKRVELYDGNVEFYFWGLTRHQWGSIHLWFSFFLLFLLALHIILHWHLIIGIFRKMVPGKKARIGIGLFLGSVCLFFALSPFLINPKIEPITRHQKHSHNMNELTIQDREHNIKKELNQNKADLSDTIVKVFRKENDHQNRDIEVYGYMTLIEVADKYGISVADLAEAIRIPVAQANVKLGRLRKTYSLYISDVKKAIVDIKNEVK
jgi:ribosomal protein S25